jgi:hypothetical protein
MIRARLHWLLWEMAGAVVLGFSIGLGIDLYIYHPHVLAWVADNAIPAVACASVPVLVGCTILARIRERLYGNKYGQY